MRPLCAAPSDVEDQVDDDQVDDEVDENGDDANTEQQDDGDTAGEGEADDADPKALKAAEQRRKIEERAAARRTENERIARETAATTVRETARVTADQARLDREAREEAEAVAKMTEPEQIQYRLAKETKATQNGLSQVRLMTQSTGDSGKFDRLLTRKPQFEKYADEVESRHQNGINQGFFTPREAILAHLIGEQTLKAENVGKQKNAAARRMKEARGGTGRGARGDSTGQPARGGKSVVQRAEEADWAI